MSLDDTMLYLRVLERVLGQKFHSRLGTLGPGYSHMGSPGLIEGSNFRGYDGLVQLHRPSKKEGEAR